MGRARASCLLFVVALLASAVGCSGTPDRTDNAGGTGRVSSPAPGPALFHRLGYRFAVPSGWFAIEGSIPWDDVAGPPHRGSPAFDTFASPESDPWIVVGKRPVTAKVSLEQWIKQLIATRAITYEPEECKSVEDDRATSLGGEKARMRAFHCPVDGPKAIAVQVLATHNKDGWVVMCFSELGKAGPISGLEQQCERWLSSFQFLP
jgi:hypothetical protein